MKVLLARDFAGIYAEPCSPDAPFGAPGTENQTYLHARHLRELGCEVCVIGNIAKDTQREGIKFLKLEGFREARDFVQEMHPDLMIAEGGSFFLRTLGTHLDAVLSKKLKNTYFLQVMHNLPLWEFHIRPDYIDYWCYVCESQKFLHKVRPSFDLFNSSFLETVYSKTPDAKKKMQFVVVGSVEKPGTLEAITAIQDLQKDYDLQAFFLMPEWGSPNFAELQARYPKIEFKNFNPRELARLLKESMAVISSFYPWEQCPVTILDSYAAGTLCITGGNGSLQYLNPAGIRCRMEELGDVLRWVIHNPEACTALGQRGLAHLKRSHHVESAQKEQLRYILEYLPTHEKPGYLQKQYNKFIFGTDKNLKIRWARRRFSELRFAIQHRTWQADVY